MSRNDFARSLVQFSSGSSHCFNTHLARSFSHCVEPSIGREFGYRLGKVPIQRVPALLLNLPCFRWIFIPMTVIQPGFFHRWLLRVPHLDGIAQKTYYIFDSHSTVNGRHIVLVRLSMHLPDRRVTISHMQSADKQGASFEAHEPVEIDELSMQCELDDQFEQLQRVRQTLEFDVPAIATHPSDE